MSLVVKSDTFASQYIKLLVILGSSFMVFAPFAKVATDEEAGSNHPMAWNVRGEWVVA